MNDHDPEFARKLVRHLDRGLDDLRPGTCYRLAQARARALAGAADALAARPELVLAGAVPGVRFRGSRSPVRWLGVVLLVAAAGFGYQQWQTVRQVHEFEDLDLQLLASDLPIDAYLDRGFQNWLPTASER